MKTLCWSNSLETYWTHHKKLWEEENIHTRRSQTFRNPVSTLWHEFHLTCNPWAGPSHADVRWYYKSQQKLAYQAHWTLKRVHSSSVLTLERIVVATKQKDFEKVFYPSDFLCELVFYPPPFEYHMFWYDISEKSLSLVLPWKSQYVAICISPKKG